MCSWGVILIVALGTIGPANRRLRVKLSVDSMYDLVHHVQGLHGNIFDEVNIINADTLQPVPFPRHLSNGLVSIQET